MASSKGAKTTSARKKSKAAESPIQLTARSGSIVDAFLSAVIADPDADEPRLVLADFWQEKGDPRGEFVNVQCSLAKLRGDLKFGDQTKKKTAQPTTRTAKPKSNAGNAKTNAGVGDDENLTTLEAREAELLKKHSKTWSAIAGSGKLQFHRGFAAAWKVHAPVFPTYAAEVFAKEPIVVLDLSQGNLLDPTKPGTMKAFKRPELARLRRLELRRLRLRAEELAEVVRCKHLENLRELDLSYVPMSLKALEAISTSSAFTKLEVLRLSGCKLGERAVAALAKAPFIQSLRKLDLSSSTIGNAGVLALASTKELSHLESLDLGWCKLGDDAAIALERSPTLANLHSLGVQQNRFKSDAKAKLEAKFGDRLHLS